MPSHGRSVGPLLLRVEHAFGIVSSVSERSRDEKLADARLAYRAAVRRLDVALRRFDTCDIPLDPGRGPEPLPWTREHVEIVPAVTKAFSDLARTRRAWDQLRREWQPGR